MQIDIQQADVHADGWVFVSTSPIDSSFLILFALGSLSRKIYFRLYDTTAVSDEQYWPVPDVGPSIIPLHLSTLLNTKPNAQ